MLLLSFVLISASTAIGVLVGVATRPTHWGVDISAYKLLFGPPFDAGLKRELISYLTLTGGIGLAVGVTLAVVATLLINLKKPV
jgi:hypothetical protein